MCLHYKVWWSSVQLLQLGLQGFEVADDVLQRRVGTQRLQLHQITTDVVQTRVGESASVVGGHAAGVVHVSGEQHMNTLHQMKRLL